MVCQINLDRWSTGYTRGETLSSQTSPALIPYSYLRFTAYVVTSAVIHKAYGTTGDQCITTTEPPAILSPAYSIPPDTTASGLDLYVVDASDAPHLLGLDYCSANVVQISVFVITIASDSSATLQASSPLGVSTVIALRCTVQILTAI